ncbi:MAG TPA: Ig-like domain repeat protein [Terriglobales bacterium]|nr:Ig-like domain repeat protein [Terriglobales bacterium]
MIQPKTIVLAALLAAGALLLLPGIASAQTLAGTTQPGFVVDHGTGIRRGAAIAVDSKNVYFAYYYIGDQPSGARGPEVMYEAFPLAISCPAHVLCGFTPPTPQAIDVLTPTPGSSLYAYTISLALDPQGIPHIFYQDGQGGMRHATIDPIAGWVHETVPLAAGLYSSMAIDASGTIHVADGPISPSGIGYATKTNGVWTTDSIIGPSTGMAGLSLAVDSQGTPQVVWADNRSTFNEVVYARRGTGAIPWTSGNFEVISGDKAYWVSLAVDANDVPSVSYWGWTDTTALTSRVVYAAKQSFGSWPLQLVDSSIIPCCITFPWDYQMTSLGVSPLGTPRIIYGFEHSSTDGGVALARLDGLSWNIEPLDKDLLSLDSQAIALVMDSSDIAHVLYIVNNCPPGSLCNDALVYERIATANTLTTSNIVNLGDPAGSGSPITVTFTQVTQNGLTSVTLDDTTTGPAPPANFQLGNPPVYYDFSTTAGFTAPIQICIPYGNVSNPSGVVLMHFENGAWQNRTVSNDIVRHIVCASVSSLSPFAAFESQTVTQSPTSIGLSSSVNPSTFGQNVTFTASLTASGSPTPSGAVTFLDGDTPLGPAVTLAGGITATFSSSALTAGTHSITAQYSGDTNYTSSTSSAVVQIVNKNGTAIALNSSPNPSTAGQLVTFSSSVAGVTPPPGVPTPTGSVTFLDGATALGPAVPVASDGSSAFTTSTLAAGTHTITAQYSGDADWGASTSSPVSQLVNGNFSTSIVVNAANTTYGTPVSATVSVNSPGGAVSGNVTLSVDGGTASFMTLSNGSAVFNFGVLNAGPHSLSANFAAQGNFLPSSTASSLSVAQASLAITANNAMRPYGANNPAFSANFSGFVSSDTSSVLVGILGCTTNAVPNSPVGMFPIMCAGLSSPNYAISFINGMLSVVPERTSVALAFSPLSIMVGQSTTATITLTAPDMVIPISPGVLAPIAVSSPVTSDILSNNGACTPVPSATPGVASCTITVTSVEPNGRTLNASFAGNADLNASTGIADLIVTAALQSQQACIASDFRNVTVPGGSYLWFNSIFKVRDVTKQLIHISFFQSNLQFQYTDSAGNTLTVNQALPDAKITINPNATIASTSFDPINNAWITTIPWDLDDNSFLTGMPWRVPSAGLPADVEPVTVCGTFASDVASVDIGWRWAAAAYSSFSGDNTTLGVKPMDTDHDNQATNHDHAGTPENYNQFLIPGARGKGGKNYTGTYSRSVAIE